METVLGAGPGGRGGLAFALATCPCLATGICNKRMRVSCCRSRCGYTSQWRWRMLGTPVFSAHGRGARAERPNTFRPGGVVAPEIAGLLSKASPVPSTAPLPSFPSPNPPHFLTVIGLLSAGEQFKSTTHSSSLLQGSRERLRAGGSQASLLALGSGSRRCRRRGDSSRSAAPRGVLHVLLCSSLEQSHLAPCAWICMLVRFTCTSCASCTRPCALWWSDCACVRRESGRSAKRSEPAHTRL